MLRVRTYLIAMALSVPGLVFTPSVHSRAPIVAQQDPRDVYIQQQVTAIARQGQGRIGVAAMDLDGGGQILVKGDQPFPMASTAKIAIAATFLKGVEEGRFRLDQEFPMMMRVRESGMRSAAAPLTAGNLLTAQTLIEMMITRSNNEATDGLLAAIGGPAAVNRFLATAGISGQQLDHTMATLVRDDGAIDPARVIDVRTSSTPRAMLALLAALDKGNILNPTSRAVLLGTMTRTTTGSRRIRAGLPAGTVVAHKTGTLSGVTDDVGIIRMPDGRHVALVVFVTGPEGHRAHDGLISQITSVVYNGYLAAPSSPLGSPARK